MPSRQLATCRPVGHVIDPSFHCKAKLFTCKCATIKLLKLCVILYLPKLCYVETFPQSTPVILGSEGTGETRKHKT